jgi:CRP-like cAMP-binding protein
MDAAGDDTQEVDMVPATVTGVELAERNAFLAGLPSPILGELRPRLRPVKFITGEVLFRCGDVIDRIYFLTSGAISLVTELSTGQMVESAMVGKDSIVGGGASLDGREAVHKAVVQVPASGLYTDVSTVRHIANGHAEFRSAIMRHEQLVLLQAQQSAACNAMHGLHERLARWLLRVRDVTGSDSFQLTQEFIAEMLGVRRTSVSITAHAFQQAGIISYRRGQIKIEKVETLRETACECYQAVRLRYEALQVRTPG